MIRRFILVIAVLSLAVACGSGETAGSSYDLAEFAITGPSRVSTGERPLTVTNNGEFVHTLVVADATGAVVAATDLVQPGETVQLPVSLGPGTYQFTCRIVAETPDGKIVDHFEAGMNTSVVVEG